MSRVVLVAALVAAQSLIGVARPSAGGDNDDVALGPSVDAVQELPTGWGKTRARR